MPSKYNVDVDVTTGIKCKASSLNTGDVFTVQDGGPLFLCRGRKGDMMGEVVGAERFLREDTYGVKLTQEVTVFPKVDISIVRY
jgi:hypothetical protein